MPTQLVIVGAYGLLAAIAAMILPALRFDLSGAVSGLAGLALFLGAATVHLAFRLRALGRDVGADRVAFEERIRGLEREISASGEPDGIARSETVEGLEKVVLKSLLERLGSLRLGRAGAKTAGKAAPKSADAEDEPIAPPGKRGRPAVIPEGLPAERVMTLVRGAVEENRVDLYLQPIVALPQRQVRFYECYSRLRDPEGSLILPQHYLEIAERAGMMSSIDNLLLLRCVQLIRGLRPAERTVEFFCNISPHSMADFDFISQFVEFLRENERLADNLVFEFPEQSLMTASDGIRRNLAGLARLGYRFSMDQVQSPKLDFARLSTLGVRYVKISPDLHLGAGRGSPDESGGAVGRIAAQNGIETIGEKIEDEQTVFDLIDEDVKYGQGFLFGQPRHLSQIPSF